MVCMIDEQLLLALLLQSRLKLLLFNPFVPDKVCQGEDKSERAGKQDCFHIAGEDDAGGHLRVDVGDEAHLVASDVKRLGNSPIPPPLRQQPPGLSLPTGQQQTQQQQQLPPVGQMGLTGELDSGVGAPAAGGGVETEIAG